jgi:hypothetical protein
MMKLKFQPALLAGLCLLASVLPAPAQTNAFANEPVPGRFRVNYYGQFSELPVGAVQPRGWLQKWLERQAQGLTGHPENLDYPYDTCMFAGLIPPPQTKSAWWKPWWPYEQSAYFVDATTRLSWLINDPAIRQRRDANLDYILAHSTGTNLGGSTAAWPNAVVGRALLAQFSATTNLAIAAVLQNWLLTSADTIAQGGRNGVNCEEAFYLYGLTGDARLLDLCSRIYAGYTTGTNSFFTAAKIDRAQPFHEHGVTAAEELKCLPLMYSYTGDPAALGLARRAYEKVLARSLMPDGGIVSSEHLDKTDFYSVHESCDISDWSWSLGYLFMATGEARYADMIERTVFNALPGAVTKDFKELQYFSAVNQTRIGPTNDITPHWPTRMTYRAAHDTECCAGNINRAMPDYVVRMWMRASDGGLAAAYYGPCVLTATVGGRTVAITEDTDYPFRDEIQFHIATARPVKFDFQFRIPAWCQQATWRLNDAAAGVAARANTFASVRREFHDGDILRLKLPMSVRAESWFGQANVSLTRGPLVYSLPIDALRVEHTNDPENLKVFLDNHEIRGFPEVEFLPQGDWRFGFNEKSAASLQKVRVVESPMPDNPFLAAQAPVRLEVPLCPLPGWAPTPRNPAAGLARPFPGPEATLTLIPYGATYLRVTTLPLVQVGN